jgi:Xaa-Pro aminopeptidase
MQTLQPALLHGNYEWQPALQPEEEFAARVEAAREMMRAQGIDALIVHGDSRENAALCWLTNVVPNQRWALALLDRERPLQLLASVGPRDHPAVARLTWVKDIRASGEVRAPVSQFLATMQRHDGNRRARVATAHLGRMRSRLGRELVETCGDFGTMDDATGALAGLRMRKSVRELALVRRSYAILQTAFAGVEQRRRAGAGIAAALSGAECAARLAGAQDVRALCGAAGSGFLQPVDGASGRGGPPPWTVYVAVRFCGYWTEAAVTLAAGDTGPVQETVAALERAIAAARPGTTGRALQQAMRPALNALAPHATLGAKVARAHGLSLDMQSWITASSDEALCEASAYVLLAGGADAAGRHALASATVIFDPQARAALHPLAAPDHAKAVG